MDLHTYNSFRIGWKLGRTVCDPENDLTLAELQEYAPDADIDALSQGFEDGKKRDRFRLDLGKRLVDEKLGIERKG